MNAILAWPQHSIFSIIAPENSTALPIHSIQKMCLNVSLPPFSFFSLIRGLLCVCVYECELWLVCIGFVSIWRWFVVYVLACQLGIQKSDRDSLARQRQIVVKTCTSIDSLSRLGKCVSSHIARKCTSSISFSLSLSLFISLSHLSICSLLLYSSCTVQCVYMYQSRWSTLYSQPDFHLFVLY